MISKKCFLEIGFFIMFMMNACARQDEFPVLKDPYLGQEPPGKTPEIFSPGLISTHLSQSYIAFLDGARVCVFSTSTERGHETYFTYEHNGRWTKPERAPFEELQGHPNYTTGPLGRRVYYHSGNPTYLHDDRLDDNIWTIEWTGSGWAEPEALPEPANSEYGEAYPSAAEDGTVYFFTWRREGTRGYDIWHSRCDQGKYREAERLPWPVNTDFIEYDPYVAPDESFLIFGSDRPGGFGKSDNYICFRREDGSWTSPMNLGRPYNSSSFDLCANGTPDGKYFFFTSGRKTEADKGGVGLTAGEKPEEDADLYWADFTFIDDLKNILFTRQNAAKIIRDDYRENGIRSAVDTLTGLYRDRKDSHYFLPFELLSLAKDMLTGGEIEDADLFSSALEKALPEDLSIREGYARICAMNGFVSKGMEIFEELDREDPDFDLNEALSSLGYLFTLYPEKTQDALSVLRFTVEKFPEDPWAYYGLARVYRRLGDLDKAITNCRKSLELSPQVGDISQMLERLLEERERRKESSDSFPVLKGPYLGQEPPGKTAEVFAPGVISTCFNEHGISFTPDGKELYFRLLGPPRGAVYAMSSGENGQWTRPEIAPFLEKYDAKCSLSPDGGKVVFSTNRPKLINGEPLDHWEIWVSERGEIGWSEPTNIGLISGHDVACPSISNSGNLYYYSDSISGGLGNGDIYISKYENGNYSEPINLGIPINTEFWENDPYISPDESFIIFQSDREGNHEFGDLYISFKDKQGEWMQPINMGDRVNSPAAGEGCPWVTPDGKYLFFSSMRFNQKAYQGEALPYETKMEILNGPCNGSEDIFWVDARLIEELKPERR